MMTYFRIDKTLYQCVEKRRLWHVSPVGGIMPDGCPQSDAFRLEPFAGDRHNAGTVVPARTPSL
ncbi:MAG: hypothetical protein AAGG46_08790, partial [Planctomycetota bacterium]